MIFKCYKSMIDQTPYGVPMTICQKNKLLQMSEFKF